MAGEFVLLLGGSHNYKVYESVWDSIGVIGENVGLPGVVDGCLLKTGPIFMIVAGRLLGNCGGRGVYVVK